MVMNLPKGAGRETAEVVGAFSLAKLWQAALSRSDLPERERADFHCYLDEFQNFLHAEDFAEILAEARALRLSLCLAHQTLAQLNERETTLLLNLVRNLVCFQPGHEDAARLARALAPSFDRDDLHRLGPYQVAVRLTQHGATAARLLRANPPTTRLRPSPLDQPLPHTTPPATRSRRARAGGHRSADRRRSSGVAGACAGRASGSAGADSSRCSLAGGGRSLDRVQALEQLPSRSDSPLPAAHGRAPRAASASSCSLSRAQIQQRIVTVALARARHRHDADPAGSPKDTALLQAGLSEEEWASAVEQERLQRLRRISALRYDRPVDEVEVAIRRRLGGAGSLPANDGAEDIP